MSTGDDERSVRLGGGRGGRLLLAALLTLVSTGARAQETPPAEPPAEAAAEAPPEGSNIGFEEQVTVTARKLGEETAQEVPTSIAAPSEEQLRNRGARNLGRRPPTLDESIGE